MNGCSLIRSDLSNSTLERADLSGADLSYCNLGYANLQDAVLSGANLTSADFSWSNLNGANLRGARLDATTFTMADFTGADLRGALIVNADLESAIFMNALVGITKFVNCDLSNVIGLDFAKHTGPSTLALDTIARSGGMIPRVFLERAGVAGPLVAVQDAMRGVNRAFPTVLIVGSSEDGELAGRICSGLAESQIPAWSMAADNETALYSGDILFEHTPYYDRLILLCTAQSLDNSQASKYFAQLLGSRRSESGRTILALAADDLLYRREDHLCNSLKEGTMLDFRGWEDGQTYDEALESLVEVLSRKAF